MAAHKVHVHLAFVITLFAKSAVNLARTAVQTLSEAELVRTHCVPKVDMKVKCSVHELKKSSECTHCFEKVDKEDNVVEEAAFTLFRNFLSNVTVDPTSEKGMEGDSGKQVPQHRQKFESALYSLGAQHCQCTSNVANDRTLGS